MATAVFDGLWLRVHGRHEKSLKTVLTVYFKEQAERVAAAVAQFDHPSPAILSQVFRVHDEHDKLIHVVSRPLAVAMAQGAQNVIDAFRDRADPSKQMDAPWFDFGLLGPMWFDLPDDTRAAISQHFEELISQPYWMQIQEETATKIDLLLESGVEQGANAQRIARLLRESLGGMSAYRRALKIARTETTGALNSGQQAQQQTLERLGEIVTKTWWAVGDTDMRETHGEASGQKVRGSAALFSVGGHPARYPGDSNLPAQERINCRCAMLTEIL